MSTVGDLVCRGHTQSVSRTLKICFWKSLQLQSTRRYLYFWGLSGQLILFLQTQRDPWRGWTSVRYSSTKKDSSECGSGSCWHYGCVSVFFTAYRLWEWLVVKLGKLDSGRGITKRFVVCPRTQVINWDVRLYITQVSGKRISHMDSYNPPNLVSNRKTIRTSQAA
jgi:hypothetical protein